jgi:hypothetical protein
MIGNDMKMKQYLVERFGDNSDTDAIALTVAEFIYAKSGTGCSVPVEALVAYYEVGVIDLAMELGLDYRALIGAK